MLRIFRKYRYRYNKKIRQQVLDCITGQFGPVARVIPSFTNRDLPVDIAVIPPSEERACYTLVTLGMGAYRIPAAKAPHRHLELAIRLPADWQLENNREVWFWPIRWLQILARMPMYQKTWFTHGHTVDICRHIVGKEGFWGFALHWAAREQQALPMGKKAALTFLALVPIYREELEAAKKGDTEDVFALLGEAICFGPVDTARKNTCL